MSQQELINKIVESINQSNNELLLAETYDLLQTNKSLNKSKHQILKMKKSLTRGLKDFEEGRVISDEAKRKPYAKYFK